MLKEEPDVNVPEDGWPLTAPLVLTLEFNWLRQDYEGPAQGRAFWVDCSKPREQVSQLGLEQGLNWAEAGRAWGARAGRQSGLNEQLSLPVSWEWRELERGSKRVGLAVVRCFVQGEELLDEKAAALALGLDVLAALPCAGETHSFVGSSARAWLEAIEALKEGRELSAAVLEGQAFKRGSRL